MDKNILIKLLLDELEDSESEHSLCSDTSDSSDMESIMTAVLSCVSQDNQKDDYFKAQIPNYTDKEFIKHFRISRDLYKDLAQRFFQSKDYNKLHTSRIYSADVQLALFLWFAGRENCTNRDICKQFKLPLGSLYRAIDRVLQFLNSLFADVVRWPTEEEQKRIDCSIKEKTGIHGAVGIIDCIRIRIDPPRQRKQIYLDKKTNSSSLCLQGICDERMKFTDISVGSPGTIPNNKVFKRSEIHGDLENLCQNGFLLGGAGYTCSRFMLTPYRDNRYLSTRNKLFNKNLNIARLPIKQAFVLLTRRFRQLKHCKLRTIGKVCSFVRACVVLHNLSNDDFDFDSDDEEIEFEERKQVPCQEKEDSSVRDRVCEDMFVHFKSEA